MRGRARLATVGLNLYIQPKNDQGDDHGDGGGGSAQCLNIPKDPCAFRRLNTPKDPFRRLNIPKDSCAFRRLNTPKDPYAFRRLKTPTPCGA